jgi:carboxyl-terminal processing protease
MKIGRFKNFIFGGLILLLFSGFFPGKSDVYFEISKNMELFGRIYKEISFNYVDDINPEEFMRAGIKGMLGSLDPYTIFIDENRQEDIELITNGKYGGVGISIGVRGDHVTVVEVLEGYSAQKQGIRIGDKLIEAGGVEISRENVDEISSLVKGDPGSTVELKIVRNDDIDTVTFNLIREEIVIKNLTYSGFYPENSGNVYLKLSNFSRSAGDELKKALRELKNQREIESIVLDLRGNPGGLLDVAVDICDKFLEKDQLIVTTKGRETTTEKSYFSVQEPMVGKSKLIVLVNEGSASASEIVAGAIQDHDRGVILGAKTFGKGLVQTITPLNFNTSLKITTAKYYTPSGRCIQKIDYSRNNKVIASVDSIISTSFFTDNKREVYSAGGITPDSTVLFEIEGDMTKELLAKGIFFQFADNYFYSNPDIDFKNIDDSKLLADFDQYLIDKNFQYKTEAEKQVDKLLADVETNNMDASIVTNLRQIKTQFDKMGNSELKIYKDEILREAKNELASRYLGSEHKILESLETDKQFQTALSVIKNNSVYDRILNSKKSK